MRILIVKLSSLGDLCHALPAVHGLKAGLKADVDWVTQSEYVELVRCFEDVADVIPFDRRGFPRGAWAFLRRLRLRSYDLVVDLQGLMKSAIVARLARGRRILGPSFHREGSGILYHAVAGLRNRERHAVEENLDAVRFLGLPVPPARFPLRVPSVARPEGQPRVALFPFSRRAIKNWPEERYIHLGRRLRDERGAHLFLMGGQDDYPACAEVEKALNADGRQPAVANLAGRTRLVETAGWLSAMDLVIGNDSGPIHLAAAQGVPVLALFGPTDPRRTGPYGDRHRVLVSGVPCRPCHERTCRYGSTACMDSIGVDEVFHAAAAMLDAGAARGPEGLTHA